jgi:hypothetical protein
MLKRTIKLNMNEMPYLPSKDIIEAARKGLLSLNRYTEPEDIERLRELLADYSGVPKGHVILGPGSDLLLREVIQTFSKGRKIVIVSPSFFPTVQTAKQFARKLISIRLSPPEFDLNLDLLIDELREPCLVVIDNPNNPTGKILLDRYAVEAIIKNIFRSNFCGYGAGQTKSCDYEDDGQSVQLGGSSSRLYYRWEGLSGGVLLILCLSTPIQPACSDRSVEESRLYEEKYSSSH